MGVTNGDTNTQRYAVNPFAGPGWRPVTKTKYKKVNLEAGEPFYNLKGERLTGIKLEPVELDAGRFVKVAHEVLPELSKLSATARAVLDFAMSQALPNNEVVWVPAVEGAAFCRLNQTKSFYNGVSELLAHEFIARTEKMGFYFINPNKWFNGVRENRKTLFNKPDHNKP